MLNVQNVSYHYGKQTVLNQINLHIHKGDLITLLGANGAGKSTLLNCMAGLLKPTAGQIFLENRPLASLSSKQIAQKMAYVSQHSPQTYQYLVRDYIALGRATHLGLFNKPSEADYALVDQALARLDIEKLANKIYMQTSGGEKQLINLAKILVQQPEIILFDEPTSALDYGNMLKTLKLIQSLAQEHFTIVMTTHNPDHPLLLQETIPHSKVALLDHSGQLQVGSPDDIITEANLQQLYQIELKLYALPQLNRPICAVQQL